MAAIANLIVDQGASFSSDITVKDANGNAFNLTGYTAEAKLAKGYSSTRTRTTMTSSISSDPASGVVSLSLTSAQTTALDAPEIYVYDVEITQTSTGNVTRVIIPSITLVTLPVDVCVISTSYTYLSGASKAVVWADVRESDTIPDVGSLATVEVIVVLVLVEE